MRDFCLVQLVKGDQSDYHFLSLLRLEFCPDSYSASEKARVSWVCVCFSKSLQEAISAAPHDFHSFYFVGYTVALM